MKRRILGQQRAVDLVRGYVMEPMCGHQALVDPERLRGLEQRMRAHHVGADEIVGTQYRAIDVRFCGEMHQSVDLETLHHLAHGILVADVLAHEGIARVTLQALEILGIPSVGERV